MTKRISKQRHTYTLRIRYVYLFVTGAVLLATPLHKDGGVAFFDELVFIKNHYFAAVLSICEGGGYIRHNKGY